MIIILSVAFIVVFLAFLINYPTDKSVAFHALTKSIKKYSKGKFKSNPYTLLITDSVSFTLKFSLFQRSNKPLATMKIKCRTLHTQEQAELLKEVSSHIVIWKKTFFGSHDYRYLHSRVYRDCLMSAKATKTPSVLHLPMIDMHVEYEDEKSFSINWFEIQ